MGIQSISLIASKREVIDVMTRHTQKSEGLVPLGTIPLSLFRSSSLEALAWYHVSVVLGIGSLSPLRDQIGYCGFLSYREINKTGIYRGNFSLGNWSLSAFCLNGSAKAYLLLLEIRSCL